MSYAARLLCFVAISVAFHLLGARGMSRLPAASTAKRPPVVEVQLRTPPPAPNEPAAAHPQPAPPLVVESPLPARRSRRVATAAARPGPRRPPIVATERPSTGGDAVTTSTPTFGVSMESTSRAGTGSPLPVGNTVQTKPGPRASGSPVKPLAAPVAAHEVTKLPLPLGRCSGRYTERARETGLEGTVVLDLVVGEDGRVRQVIVVKGLAEGLTEAAVTAARGCRFTPGEREGRAVAVRLRGFKIRFFLQGSD